MTGFYRYHVKYDGDLDERMWGAFDQIGYVKGGMPLKVAHELLTHFIPGYLKDYNVLKITGLYAAKQPPTITATLRKTGGLIEIFELKREDVEDWLDRAYPAYHSGFHPSVR